MDSARRAGVERILVPGWDLGSSQRAVDLAAAHPLLNAAVGVHPHEAAAVDATAWSAIELLARSAHVVAIGETGLDHDRAFSPLDEQVTNLRRNLDLALATGKPAILHCRSAAGRRDAQDLLLAELQRAGVGGTAWGTVFDGRAPAVIHSFSGPPDYALAMLELGLAISFSGLVFRAGEEASSEVAALVPDERLLVETDSPFLSPPGAPRRRNEPAWVRVTAGWVAERRGTSLDRLGPLLVQNYDRTFQRQGEMP